VTLRAGQVAIAATLLLGGCAQAAIDAKRVTYDQGLVAIERNHDFRLDARETCRQMVLEDVSMYRRNAMILETAGEFDAASAERRKAAEVLKESFPPLVLAGSIEVAIESRAAGSLAEVFPLRCYGGAIE